VGALAFGVFTGGAFVVVLAPPDLDVAGRPHAAGANDSTAQFTTTRVLTLICRLFRTLYDIV